MFDHFLRMTNNFGLLFPTNFKMNGVLIWRFTFSSAVKLHKKISLNVKCLWKKLDLLSFEAVGGGDKQGCFKNKSRYYLLLLFLSCSVPINTKCKTFGTKVKVFPWQVFYSITRRIFCRVRSVTFSSGSGHQVTDLSWIYLSTSGWRWIFVDWTNLATT